MGSQEGSGGGRGGFNPNLYYTIIYLYNLSHILLSFIIYIFLNLSFDFYYYTLFIYNDIYMIYTIIHLNMYSY